MHYDNHYSKPIWQFSIGEFEARLKKTVSTLIELAVKKAFEERAGQLNIRLSFLQYTPNVVLFFWTIVTLFAVVCPYFCSIQAIQHMFKLLQYFVDFRLSKSTRSV